MAIQIKLGKLSDLDTSRLQKGEKVCATDKDFIAYAKGQSDIVELATKKEGINMVKSGTLVDVVGKKLIFTSNRVQPTLKFTQFYTSGSTYDLQYADAYPTVEYIIKEYLKICKPQLIYDETYEVMSGVFKKILRELKGIVNNNELVDIAVGRNSDMSVYIDVYHGSPMAESFTISSINLPDSRMGHMFYRLRNSVGINGRLEIYVIEPTGEYERRSQTSTHYVSNIGSNPSATAISGTNIGMTADYVINDNDWEWDFSKMERWQYEIGGSLYFDDLVDGISGNINSNVNAKIEDDQLVIMDKNAFASIPFLFQLGRTVEIEFGICDRAYTQTQSQGKNYTVGLALGNYISNASQYASPYYALEFPYYLESNPSATFRIRGLYNSSDPVDIADPNILSERKLISKFENGNWIISVGGSTVSYEYSPRTHVYSRIGRVGGYSNDYALYTTRVKRITVN